MESYILALHLAVFAAALLQAATGIGFGIIAGPIILMVMNSASAIQVSILLSLLIALVLAPSLYGRADKPLLARLLLGAMAGLPLGIFVYLQVGVDLLKLLAGLAVLVAGIGAGGFSAMQSTIILLSAPREQRGQVLGLLVVCIGAGPIGFLHLGFLAHWLGAAEAVTVLLESDLPRRDAGLCAQRHLPVARHPTLKGDERCENDRHGSA